MTQPPKPGGTHDDGCDGECTFRTVSVSTDEAEVYLSLSQIGLVCDGSQHSRGM